jgi:hypothetical protein
VSWGADVDGGTASGGADVGPDVEVAPPPSTSPSGIARGGLRREGGGKRRSGHRRRGGAAASSNLLGQRGWGLETRERSRLDEGVLRVMQFCGFSAGHAA